MSKFFLYVVLLLGGVAYGFGATLPVMAVELDSAKCIDYFQVYKNKCELSIEKINISDSDAFGDCNEGPNSYKDPIASKIDFVINNYFNTDEKPSTNECIDMHITLYVYKNKLYEGEGGGGDMQKCISELLTCANLFQQCQGNTGVIKMNDLENQCKEFLSGGKTWAQLSGNDLCSQATTLKTKAADQCKTYTQKLEEAKQKGAYVPPPRGYLFDEEAEAVRKAQQAELEGLAKGTFSKLGDRTPQQIFGGVIKTITGIIGSIALAMFVYGGIMIMSAAGNSERTKQGTQIVIWSALGVVVILASYALVDLVFDVFR